MTEFLIRRFIPDASRVDDPAVRARYGSLSGAVGVCCNLLLSASKFLVGTLSGSVSLTADAVNNLSDASSSVVTLLGFRLSRRPPDEEHPFGHARMEYLSGLTVAALILLVGVRLAGASIDKIVAPTPVAFSAAMVAVPLFSIAVKFWMARFNRRLGARIRSASLMATAADSRNDVVATASVLVSAVLERLTGLPLDGYVGLLVALFILYSGAKVAKDTVNPLLGEPADEALVAMIRREILGYDPRVLGLHDLMVHDYGPGQRFATAHAEIDARQDVMTAHDILDNLERQMMDKHRIHLVLHYDPVVTDDPELNRIHAELQTFLLALDPQLTTHDFRMVRGADHTNLIFDLVLPHAWRGREKDLKRRLDDWAAHREGKYYVVATFDSVSFNR